MTPKLLISCAIVAVFASCANLGRNEQPSSSPRVKEIRTAMNRAVIPEVDLENVTAVEALRVWSERSREYHPLHFKFQYTVSYPMVFSKGAITTSAAPERPSKVTVRRRSITSKRLLDEICRQSNLTWRITGRVVVIQPAPARTDQRP